MIKELIIPNYYDKQLVLEEQYYDKYKDILEILILALIALFEGKNPIEMTDIYRIKDDFLSNNSYILEKVTSDMVTDTLSLAQETAPTYREALLDVYKIREQVLYKLKNMIDAIVSRFIALIPIGAAIIGELLLNDENTKEDLINRSTKNISNFIQQSVSGGVSYNLMKNFESMGADEYVADNVHDKKVRDTHRHDNDGETWHSFVSPPKSGLPGTEWNCRCYYIKIRKSDEKK